MKLMQKLYRKPWGTPIVSTTMNIYGEVNQIVTRALLEKLSKNTDAFLEKSPLIREFKLFSPKYQKTNT